MNYLDIIIIIPLLWAVYRGFTKGLIIAVAGLAALILGIYGAIYFSGFAMSFLMKYIDKDPETLRIISFALTFIVIVLLVHLVARLLDSLIRAIALGFVNRLAGVVFNGLKMAFILSIIIGILNFFDPHSEMISRKDKDESFLYPPVAAIAPLIFPYFRFEHFHFPAPEKKTDTVIKET